LRERERERETRHHNHNAEVALVPKLNGRVNYFRCQLKVYCTTVHTIHCATHSSLQRLLPSQNPNGKWLRQRTRKQGHQISVPGLTLNKRVIIVGLSPFDGRGLCASFLRFLPLRSLTSDRSGDTDSDLSSALIDLVSIPNERTALVHEPDLSSLNFDDLSLSSFYCILSSQSNQV
jgi:hypothetical protein